jgi:Ca2+-binding RTX toxin-like protein
LIDAGGGNDVITLGNGLNFVQGGSGDDTIIAGNGNNLLLDGGDGNDTITTGNGNNNIAGGNGDDTITVGNGNNTIDAGSGDNVILVGNGDNQITAGDGDNELDIGDYNNGSGTNTIVFGNGDNRLTDFGDGVDIITMGDGQNIMDAGGGNDIITLGNGVNYVQGGAGDDIIHTGDGNDQEVEGNDGNDTIFSGGGDDLVEGDGGNDKVDLGTGNDTYVYVSGDGVDTLEGGDGRDTLALTGSKANETITISANGQRVLVTDSVGAGSLDMNSVENISIDAGAGNDIITAGAGLSALTSLTINGGAGNDTITGGDGNDVLIGGTGNDTILGGAGDDRIIWNSGDGIDQIDGQAGFDTFVLNGSKADENIGIAASGGHAVVSVDVGNVALNTLGVERVEIGASAGADHVTIGDLTGTGVQQVAINLASTPTGTAGDNQVDTVDVSAGSGDAHISIANSGKTVTVTGLAEQVSITGAEAKNDVLVVHGLGGNDTIDASHLATAHINLTIDGGAGNDNIAAPATTSSSVVSAMTFCTAVRATTPSCGTLVTATTPLTAKPAPTNWCSMARPQPSMSPSRRAVR